MLETVVPRESAHRLATQEIERRRAAFPHLQQYNDWTPAELKSETDKFWTFVSGSEQWYEDGGVPAALYVTIDRHDGHIWSDEEIKRYYMAQAKQATRDAA